MVQEDGTDKLVEVNEPEIIKFVADNLRAPIGLWIGGLKFTVVRSEDACEQGDFTFKTVLCVRPGGGCHVVVTAKGLIILAIFQQSQGQSSNEAKTAALKFGEYLSENGY